MCFIVKGTIEFQNKNMDTMHVSERANRIIKVEQLIVSESAKEIGAFIVDKGHKNGDEIHVVYNNGVVRIYNLNTGRHITDLIARLPQVERYGIKPTKTMKNKIKKHINESLNYM